MRGFKKLVLFGVLLATLLVIIDIIDAKKNDYKKKEVDVKSGQEYGSKKDSKFEKTLKSESHKSDKYKKSNSLKEGGSKKYFTEDSTTERKNYKVKRGTKYTKKDSKTFEEGLSPKITKTFQKVKKYKIVENNPSEKHFSSKTKAKTTKSKVEKEETVDEVFQTAKEIKKNGKDNMKLEDILQEDISNQFNEEAVILEEEGSGSSPRRKKYKLVEVVLEEDGDEEKEINETIIESEAEEGEDETGGIHRTESEEVIEKFKTTHSVKMPKLNKKSSKKDSAPSKEEHIEEQCPMKFEIASDYEVGKGSVSDNFESQSSLDEESEAYESCQPAPDDPNRTGPKKLTLYVIEEEIDGELKKRVVSEEDGVTLCEVADLMREQYFGL